MEEGREGERGNGQRARVSAHKGQGEGNGKGARIKKR